ASSSEAGALTELWRERWPNSQPIADELKTSEHNRWVRFHSLPDSKSAATVREDWARHQEPSDLRTHRPKPGRRPPRHRLGAEHRPRPLTEWSSRTALLQVVAADG